MSIVELYLNRLRGILDEKKAHVFKAHINFIKRMLKYELSTLEDNIPPTEIKRKSILPFIVMGYPVWMVQFYPDNKVWTCFEHFTWMYRLGNIIGHVDDAVDYRDDEEKGHPNIFNSQNQRRCFEKLDEFLASEIIRVQKTWANKAEDIEMLEPTRYALGVMIISWLGGVSNENYQKS